MLVSGMAFVYKVNVKEIVTKKGPMQMAEMRLTWRRQDGGGEKITDGISATVWGQQVGYLLKYRPSEERFSVYVEGKLEENKYTDSSGNKVTKHRLNVRQINLCNPKYGDDNEKTPEAATKELPSSTEEFDPFADEA